MRHKMSSISATASLLFAQRDQEKSLSCRASNVRVSSGTSTRASQVIFCSHNCTMLFAHHATLPSSNPCRARCCEPRRQTCTGLTWCRPGASWLLMRITRILSKRGYGWGLQHFQRDPEARAAFNRKGRWPWNHGAMPVRLAPPWRSPSPCSPPRRRRRTTMAISGSIA